MTLIPTDVRQFIILRAFYGLVDFSGNGSLKDIEPLPFGGVWCRLTVVLVILFPPPHTF
jgi:hypothetical protein